MTKTIKTCLKEDKEVNENQCKVLQLIRAELSGLETDGDLALRQIVMTPIEDDDILDLRDDIFDMIEFGPNK